MWQAKEVSDGYEKAPMNMPLNWPGVGWVSINYGIKENKNLWFSYDFSQHATALKVSFLDFSD